MRLIDADALIEDLKYLRYIKPSDIARIQNFEIWRCISAVQDAPTIEERPTGEWNKWEDERWGGVWHYCSNCHNDALYKQVDGIFKQILSDFCPNCGAKMKGEEE